MPGESIVRVWMLLVYGSARMYGGNRGYEDTTELRYAYDNLVPNSKLLTIDDIVILVGKQEVIGTAQVRAITVTPGSKERHRCPFCGTPQSKRRTRATPQFRCNNGHEFDEADVQIVPCDQYVAEYGNTFQPWTGVTLQQVRNACRNYNGQLSIQLMEPSALRALMIGTGHRPDLVQQIPHRYRKFWAAICQPDRYRFDEEYAAHSESTWTLPKGDVRAGDGILVWMAGGKKRRRRGIAAVGTVLTDPEVMPQPTHLQKYWNDDSGTVISRQAWVRYERLRNLPLQLGGDCDELLLSLKVSRSQGSGAFEVTREQWNQVSEILGGFEVPTTLPLDLDIEASAYSDVEGRRRLVLHYRLDRSSELVRRKKVQVLQQTGKLACECCGFDFGETFGDAGTGFCECHHIQPLHTLRQETISTLEDLAIVCANCHRMLHRIPECDPTKLRQFIAGQSSLPIENST